MGAELVFDDNTVVNIPDDVAAELREEFRDEWGSVGPIHVGLPDGRVCTMIGIKPYTEYCGSGELIGLDKENFYYLLSIEEVDELIELLRIYRSR